MPKRRLVVASDLAAEPEHKTPVRVRLQVPGLARHDRRAAREGDRDRRRQFEPLGRQCRKGKRREDVVRELGGHHRIEPGFLGDRREPPASRQCRIGIIVKTRISHLVLIVNPASYLPESRTIFFGVKKASYCIERAM